jgi:hypothetical protein
MAQHLKATPRQRGACTLSKGIVIYSRIQKSFKQIENFEMLMLVSFLSFAWQ